MEDKRKVELFDELLFYIREIVHDTDEVKQVLSNLGLTEAEIAYYGSIGEL